MNQASFKQKEPTTSLLDSVFYQSALRVNRLEDNKLKKVRVKIENDFERQYNQHTNISYNAYEWAIKMKRTSGRTYRVNPARLKSGPTRPKTVPETKPSCCVMYGMIIGERPVLLKHFLGRKAKKRKAEPIGNEIHIKDDHRNIQSGVSGEKRMQTPITRISTAQPMIMPRRTSDILNSSEFGEEEEYKTFMYDNKLVTQVPIGYARPSVRPHTSFVPHTSDMLRLENTKLPKYHSLRYKYVLPPICMFR